MCRKKACESQGVRERERETREGARGRGRGLRGGRASARPICPCYRTMPHHPRRNPAGTEHRPQPPRRFGGQQPSRTASFRGTHHVRHALATAKTLTHRAEMRLDGSRRGRTETARDGVTDEKPPLRPRRVKRGGSFPPGSRTHEGFPWGGGVHRAPAGQQTRRTRRVSCVRSHTYTKMYYPKPKTGGRQEAGQGREGMGGERPIPGKTGRVTGGGERAVKLEPTRARLWQTEGTQARPLHGEASGPGGRSKRHPRNKSIPSKHQQRRPDPRTGTGSPRFCSAFPRRASVIGPRTVPASRKEEAALDFPLPTLTPTDRPSP